MTFYFHNSVRKLVAAILDEFNDIQVQKYDSQGEVTSTKSVPIIFGTGTRAFFFSKKELDEIIKGNYNFLPRASLAIVAFIKANGRDGSRLKKVLQFLNPLGGKDYSMNSVSYDITFELNFVTKTMTHAMMIFEQIVPRFNPSLNIRYKELDLDIEGTNVSLELDTSEISIDDVSETDIRLVNLTFYIRAKTNIYHPITNSDIIKTVTTKLGGINTDGTTDINVETNVYNKV